MEKTTEIKNLKQPVGALIDIMPKRNGNFNVYKKVRLIGNIVDLRQTAREKKSEKAPNTEQPANDILFYLNQPDQEIPAEKFIGREPIIRPDISQKDGFVQETNELRESESDDFEIKNKFYIFLSAALVIALIIPAFNWLNLGLNLKKEVFSKSASAYYDILKAKESIEKNDWQSAKEYFSSARLNFKEADFKINGLNKLIVSILENLPGGAYVSSGAHLVRMGEDLSAVGQNISGAVGLFLQDDLINLLAGQSDEKISLTGLISDSRANLVSALGELQPIKQNLKNNVLLSGAPLDSKLDSLIDRLPLVESLIKEAVDWSDALLKILGRDNMRQYLLLFQNNSEIRPTGGFIGTYGLLVLDDGQIRKLFIDGIFNPDGQLREKIIPPRPIQKISTAWSMHDANWFADFPTSAQKIEWFYEKTGGPTVDGVISLTPTVIEKLLAITGPMDMPEYSVILSSDNFIELVQYKVEIDYDKELNQPKQILADFAPKFISALFNLSVEKQKEVVKIIFNSLKEKHALVYFNDATVQSFIQKQGWAGELRETDNDYLNVVSTNLNGYKTDKVISEKIEHQSEVQTDGSIINTLKITRQHLGGSLQYDWWNRVNSDYLRVYLAKGSEFLSASGQTIEVYQAPFDYKKYNFKEDALVSSIESNMIIDQKTGTQIFEENGKTVFGNWVYTSPGQTSVLTYQYKLPFKIDLTKSGASYSLLAQKQSGSLGSEFIHALVLPSDWRVLNQESDNNDNNLRVDKFIRTKIGKE